MPLFPWLLPAWQRYAASQNQKRLPHALLISGNEGLGKFSLAALIAQSMLCDQPNNSQPCYQCKSCHLFEKKTHPDYLSLTPEEDQSVIKIDAVRAVCIRLQLKSQQSRYTVAVVGPAECMNIASANSFLKTLEEPTSDTLIIMVSHQPYVLLPTIRSRCQEIQIGAPDKSIVMEWLQEQKQSPQHELAYTLAMGSPLTALKMQESEHLQQRKQMIEQLFLIWTQKGDPAEIAMAWKSIPFPLLIRWLLSLIQDMVKLKFDTQAPLQNIDFINDLHGLTKQLNLQLLYQWYDHLLKMIQLHQTQVNDQLMYENMLIVFANFKGFQ